MTWSHTLSRRLNLGRALRGSPGLVHYLFAFVFLVRVISLARLTSSPFLLPSGGDMHFYDDWAQQILRGRLTDHFAFYGLPLYAYLLAFFYQLFGHSPFVPGFIQICLDAGTATLLYKIAVRVFQKGNEQEPSNNRGQLIGALAAVGWAFFVPAEAYSIILMPTAWGVFVFWFLVWEIIKTERAPTPFCMLAYGALIGLTATGIATILFLVPLVLALLLSKPDSREPARPTWLARAMAGAMLFLGLAAGTSPCWVHNYFVARDPVVLSAHSGINFWLGNNPDATGYPRFPGLHTGQAEMLKDSIDLAEAAAGRSLKRSEVSEYWSARARAYISHDFGGWLGLMGRKLANFWNAFEYDDINVIDKLRSSGVVLPGLHFGLVAALAIPGVCFSVRKFPASRWIAAAIVLHLAAVLPVFVTERYRLAVVPGLLLFAATGLWVFWQSCARARLGTAAGYLAVLAAATLLVTWPRRDPALWALKFYHSGSQALELQQWAFAREQLEKAHAYAPDSTEINLALGNFWLQQEDLRRAEGYYLAVLKMDSHHKAALSNMGYLTLSEKHWDTAINYFRAALDVDPNDAKVHYLQARAQFESGHYEAALTEIQSALRLKPGQQEFETLRELIQGRK
jgi:tetratricopeptide (TPR) repeat protein